ncbi:GntR family transcriptional regulator [Spiractinospora alimapuensis]|uniref:GntR family transcriptional regulator n=1 Tax=Spiractinospora alimapuensis TaxID=2820884 RepID=UPI001F207726|nr:GntR family transcriptional regulator [Spiractinospora alimapuensis]QVQ50076.1 GntR family transcriptional regulator [Spiractinospora alimapuensis]
MNRAPTLAAQLAAGLRQRIHSGEWAPGEKLPSETTLAAELGASRATVRQAINALQEAGLVRVRHGRGTFVAHFPSVIRSGLQELRSMTATIAEQGLTPGMRYRHREVRPATGEDAERLGIAANDPVFAVERAITADDEVVAFSYDQIPANLLGADFDPNGVAGSLFDLMERYGVLPDHGVAEVRPVISPTVGWGEGVSPEGLYLLLEQTQHLADGSIVSYSRIYFVEDRFRFLIVRQRP